MHVPKDRVPTVPVCAACGDPVLLGQPRWAGDPNDRPWHYGCAERAGLTRRLFAHYVGITGAVAERHR